MSLAPVDVDAFLRESLELYDGELCQRSTDRRHSWRRTSEGGFNPRHYRVEPIKHRHARAFVERHHYSGSYSSARRRYGLIRIRRDELVGVAVLGNPMHPAAITNPLPTLGKDTAAELSRLVLLDEVPAPAESWFTTRAFDDAHEQGLKAAIAFSDPMPRPEMRGHVGIIYQAMNAAYTGRATARPVTYLPNGTVITDRSLQKVRGEESGWLGVERRLVAAGLPERQAGETPKEWLARALAEAGAWKVPHLGNHRFVFRFGTARQQRAIPLGEGYEHRSYPKTPDPVPSSRRGSPT
jgi:hypothetical protein